MWDRYGWVNAKWCVCVCVFLQVYPYLNWDFQINFGFIPNWNSIISKYFFLFVCNVFIVHSADQERRRKGKRTPYMSALSSVCIRLLCVSSPLIPPASLFAVHFVVCCRPKSFCDHFHHSLSLYEPHQLPPSSIPSTPVSIHISLLLFYYPCGRASADTSSRTRQSTAHTLVRTTKP